MKRSIEERVLDSVNQAIDNTIGMSGVAEEVEKAFHSSLQGIGRVIPDVVLKPAKKSFAAGNVVGIAVSHHVAATLSQDKEESNFSMVFEKRGIQGRLLNPESISEEEIEKCITEFVEKKLEEYIAEQGGMELVKEMALISMFLAGVKSGKKLGMELSLRLVQGMVKGDDK